MASTKPTENQGDSTSSSTLPPTENPTFAQINEHLKLQIKNKKLAQELEQLKLNNEKMMDVCACMEEFTEVTSHSSEQHVDWRDSRRKRDEEDVLKLAAWFAEHNPFPEDKDLVSLSTGVVASREMNCHRAYERGTQSLESIINKKMTDVKLKRANKVATLASMWNCNIKKIKKTQFDPLHLLHQITVSSNLTKMS